MKINSLFSGKYVKIILSFFVFSLFIFTHIDNPPKEKTEDGLSVAELSAQVYLADTHESRLVSGIEDEESDKENISRPLSDLNKTNVYVTRVIDGDTLKIFLGSEERTVRVLGIDTPETVHPNKPVECMGEEASAQAKILLDEKEVTLVTDKSQGMHDKYGRLLAYVTLPDGTDFGEAMLKGGYAYEYTYDLPYEKQGNYREAESFARKSKVGLWEDGVCDDFETTDSLSIDVEDDGVEKETEMGEMEGCVIKGNVSSNTGEKIYHVLGQQYYDKTIVSEDKGERWFCTEKEAREAGWRKALK
ncbi:MAG: thermonuclease family protein [Candidatus Paceibacterota bacterium]